MTDKYIKYRSDYDYQLHEDYVCTTTIMPKQDIDKLFIALDKEGTLTVKRGYAWDGSSGIIDTNSNLRASLVHDALYQLMRNEDIPREEFKDKSDRLFQTMCKEDGTYSWMAYLYYRTLKRFGDPATAPSNVKRVQTAP